MPDGRTVDVVIPYRPRSHFLPYHNRTERWAWLLAHRRAGKTVATVNDVIRKAIERPGRYAYIAPYFVQAKDIAWAYVKQYTAPIVAHSGKVNEAELSVSLPGGAQVRLYGAENGERLRGVGLRGLVCDEYADFPPNLWGEVLLPTLAESEGWATFIGTAKGRNNDFYRKGQHALSDPTFFRAELRASQTGILSDAELALQRAQMSVSQYAQEYECSFEAAIKGAIYAEQIETLRADKRIARVPHDPALPVHTWWDLGVGDSTSIGFIQRVGPEVRAIDYYEASGEGLPHYAGILQRKGYTYGKHYAPHDIAVRELGSGRSRIETAASLGINFEITPNLPLEDGIHAARMLLPRMWFDEVKCERWLDALANYQWAENKQLGEFKTTPVHNWASHGADMTRYLAVSLQEEKPKRKVDNDPFGAAIMGRQSAGWMG